MKTHHSISVLKPVLLIVFTLFISSVIFAQEEILRDTIAQDTIIQDTIAQDTTTQDSSNLEKSTEEKQAKKKRDSFKIFGGGTYNSLDVSSYNYESDEQMGFLLGFSYKRGRIFYYELGARYKQDAYKLTDLGVPENGDDSFSVSMIDIPIMGGINITSVIDRILGVRIFAGVVPAFRLSVGDNNLEITNESTNTLNLLGQGGIGLDVAFIFLETGINYGFSDLLKNDIQSNPLQFFIYLVFAQQSNKKSGLS